MIIIYVSKLEISSSMTSEITHTKSKTNQSVYIQFVDDVGHAHGKNFECFNIFCFRAGVMTSSHKPWIINTTYMNEIYAYC